jgi:hypothetical protein
MKNIFPLAIASIALIVAIFGYFNARASLGNAEQAMRNACERSVILGLHPEQCEGYFRGQ